MDESGRANKRQRSDSGGDEPKFFIYTNKTKSADIPKSTLTHLRVDVSVEEIPASEFDGCKELVVAQLPLALETVGESAFRGCSNLKSVQFFRNAASLDTDPNNELDDASIVFPENGNLEIGKGAFRDCSSLRKVIVRSNSTKLNKSAFSGCEGLIAAELPKGIEVISPGLFQSCRSLCTVNVPSSVIVIGDGAFEECESLTSLDLPIGLQSIGCFSLRDCKSIESLDIPATVSKIGRLAFYRCSELKQISLPEQLEVIEAGMLEECSNLQYVYIPEKVRVIKRWSFGGCSEISHLRIPSSVTKIEKHAFSCCSELLSLELPEGLSTAEYYDQSNEEHEEDLEIGRVDYDGNDYMSIYSCFDLVNLVIPSNQECDGFEFNDPMGADGFLESLRFGKFVTETSHEGYEELVRKLKNRFADSPLHTLCYYQSYHPEAEMMEKLRTLLKSDPSAGTSKVDVFGMTPLHVLAVSQTPNISMILALLDGGHSNPLFFNRDSFGSTPIDYMWMNRMPDAPKLIRSLVQNVLDRTKWLDRWKSDVLGDLDSVLAKDFLCRVEEIGQVVFKVASYQRLESISLLELHLWKMKIDGSGPGECADRENCRINSGASVVIPSVLPFLDQLEVKDYACPYISNHTSYN
eukprot:scaffold1389_cov122-Cylindrotheca_fusiformis.AAC.8